MIESHWLKSVTPNLYFLIEGHKRFFILVAL